MKEHWDLLDIQCLCFTVDININNGGSMIKRYNMNKVRWIAMELAYEPYPINPWMDENSIPKAFTKENSGLRELLRCMGIYPFYI